MSPDLSSFGFVCGMQSEVAILRRALKGTTVEQRILCFGPGQQKARETAEELVARGCSTLVSVGIAGGLLKSVQSGDLIVATEIRTEDGQLYSCAADLSAWLAEQTAATMAASVLSAAKAISNPDGKRRAGLSGCVAVDMESAGVAEVATREKIPFACVRAIADEWDDHIPPVALDGLDDEGNRRILPVIRGLLRYPGQFGAILALGRRSQSAHARLLGAGLALSSG
ncbi:MAG: hypothetical protein RIC36_18155 [Rhodospirillales bacterium]